MPITFIQLSPLPSVQKQVNKKLSGLRAELLVRGLLPSFLAVLLVIITGCGAGGYAGGGIEAMSATALTIDAGQSYKFTTAVEGSPTVTYSLSGATCGTGSSCGSMSNTTGTTVVYTAPTGITTQTLVTLKAAVTGTQSASTVAITVNPAPTLTGTTPAGTVGVAYSANLSIGGGTAPLTLSISTGSLPPGLTFDATTGAITGTPTTAGTFSFTAQLTDSSAVPYVLTTQKTIVIATQGSANFVISGNPPVGLIGTAYSTMFAATGGTAPYTFNLLSGTLPLGLTLSPSGVLAGTPTTQGVSVFTLQAQDSAGNKATGVFSITINLNSLSLAISTLPNGTVNVPYNSTIAVSGGTAPYACTITAGTLPTGLKLTGCVVSGTPTVAGTSNLTVAVTDSGSPQESTSGPVGLTINPAGSLTLTSPPAGTANTPYTGTIGVTGGTAPYTCSITGGALPAGLTISNCTISGTPTTPGTTTISVKGTDSSNPALTTTGPVIIVINPGALSLSLSTLPNGTVNTPYSSTIGVAGGTAPYSCTITAGTLPAGLTLAGCLVSGTPTVAGTVNLTVKATDASSPQETTTGPVSLTINAASLSLSLSTLPSGTVNVVYSSTIGVTGGTAPYSCTITNGTLPAGLRLAGCLVSGTPTVAGTVKLTVKATDSSATQETTTGPVSLTINPAAATLTLSSPPAGTANSPYTGLIGVTGGTSPYTCALSPSTPLPAGLHITNCTIAGTPTTAATTPLTVTATDSSSPVLTTTGPVSLVIAAAAATLTIASPPAATVDTPYTGTIGITGGTAPYSCTITGTLPAGLTLISAGCVITGTPTTVGSTTVTVAAVSNGGTPTGTGPITITVNALSPLTFTGTLPNAIQNVAYAQTLTAQGGLPPYTYTLSTGALPAGINLSTNTDSPQGAVFSGTPTVVGLSAFTVTVTDSETTPQSVALPLTLLVQYPTGPNDSYLTGPYAYLFQGYDNAVLGALSYKTATVGSFTANGTGGMSAGEMDSNHQSSTATGNTISSNTFVGTYTIGADDRGTMMIIPLNANGTIGTASTYDIAVQAPISPATNSAQGNLVEYDAGTVTVGTEGSGTLLAQTSTALSAGLSGSYAFGVSGDQACALSCSADLLLGGPVGTVGQFTANGESTDGGSITGGISDTNIVTTDTTESQLSGTYSSVDQNGRVGLVLNADNITNTLYPTDFAVYVVNANQAFIMSTDKHSAFILLAGSAQLQSPTFLSGSTAINGSFVGYENSMPNPGLVGAALQQLLNLTTATIFEGSSTSTSSGCNIASVTIGGINSLTSTLGSITGLGDILGTYESTGDVDCVVGSTGRGVLDYPAPSGLLAPVLSLLGLDNPPPPRVFYLSSQNSGYFLETGYAAVGTLVNQTGAPYTGANTFTGNYVIESTPPGSAVSINSSGVIDSSGVPSGSSSGIGTALVIQDSVVQVGDLNLLTLGTATTESYGPINSTTGVFPLGTNLAAPTYTVYTISPNSFVLVNPSLTSPSVSVLY
jgi:large repetitive protein